MATVTKNCECCGATMQVKSADKAMKQSSAAPHRRHDGLGAVPFDAAVEPVDAVHSGLAAFSAVLVLHRLLP